MALEFRNLNLKYEKEKQGASTDIPTYSADYSTLLGKGTQGGLDTSLIGILNFDNLQVLQIMENPELSPIYWEGIRKGNGFYSTFGFLPLENLLRHPHEEIYESIVESFDSMKNPKDQRARPLTNRLLRIIRNKSFSVDLEGMGTLSFGEPLD